MFYYLDKEDKKSGKIHRNYFLTQGDSFALTAKINAEVDEDVVSKIVFKMANKISDCNMELFFEKEYTLSEGIWVCFITGEETSNLKPTCANNDQPYIYEIEAHYVDGGVDTLEQAEFSILPQITSKED